MSASESPVSTAPPSRAAFGFIFVTVLLDMLALGVTMPVLPKLIEGFTGGDTAQAARIFGLFSTGFALMQFVFSPLLGAVSDRFGRRPVILLSNVGLAIDYLLMAFAPSLMWLTIGRLMSGATSASISTAFAYLTDITPPEKRAAVFGQVGAAFGAGFILGPAAGGLLGQADLHLPFYVAAGLSLANTLYGLFVLPESLPPERRARFRLARANPVGAFSLLTQRPGLMGLALLNFLSHTAHTVLPSVYVLYAAARYGWSEFAIGLSLALVGLGSILSRMFVIAPVVARLGEPRAITLGLFAGIAGLLILAFVPDGVIGLVCIIPMSLWSITVPALQSLMTRRVGVDEQGRLQGAISSVQSVAQLIGPLLFTFAFAAFIGPSAPWIMPGAPFVLAAVLLTLAVMVAIAALPKAAVAKSAA